MIHTLELPVDERERERPTVSYISGQFIHPNFLLEVEVKISPKVF